MFLKPKGSNVFAPLSGTLIPLDEVNDPIFSGHVVGNGVAIQPSDGEVVAPISGQVSLISEYKYTYGIRGYDGVEVLVHLGIGTMKLQGEGFTPLVTQGQQVNAGDPICKMDLDVLKEKGCDSTTPVIITSSAVKAELIDTMPKGEVIRGQSICMRYIKK